MPIAGPPSGGGGGGGGLDVSYTTLNLNVPGAIAGEAIAVGQAIALIDDAGSLEYRLCSSTLFPLQFVGFAESSVSAGDPLLAVAGRGSVVTPIIEGGGSLTPDLPVYLSGTAGAITQTAPPGPGVTLYPIGFAIDASRITMNTDYRVVIP